MDVSWSDVWRMGLKAEGRWAGDRVDLQGMVVPFHEGGCIQTGIVTERKKDGGEKGCAGEGSGLRNTSGLGLEIGLAVLRVVVWFVGGVLEPIMPCHWCVWCV